LRKFLLTLVILGVAGFAVFWFLTVPGSVPASALGPHTADLANGKTLFYAGGCSSCHATATWDEGTKKFKQDELEKLGGGLGLKSPFGTFYVPNISPAAIGAWTEAQFVTAVVKGTSPDGRHYYPAFPYTSYQRMRVDDVRDLFAFIKTLPAIQNNVRPHDLPFPFTVRRGLGLWKFLFLDGKPFVADASKPAAWNRGAYLTNGPAHCAECHSPRNFMGGLIESQRFAGGPNPSGDGWIPNITQKGLGDYSEKDIAYILETGQTPSGDSVGGEMAAVVKETALIPAEDRNAIATFIKSLPPVEGPKPPENK
jgi:mono/diheme cytochrome c family protein